MPYANINGIKIYYEVHGEGPSLVLLQGFTRNTLMWNPIVEILKKEYQLILMDNRGSGRSQHPSPPYSIEMMAKDTTSLLDSLNIKEALFLGHSMGGAIALQISIDSPERVKKAIICSSFAKVPETSLMQIDIVSNMAEAGIPRELILQMVLPWHFSSKCLEASGAQEHLIKAMLKDPYPQKPEGFLGQGEALKSYNIVDKISQINCPFLIIVGEDDLYTPISCSKLLKEKIKMAQMKIIPHQGHMITEEVPELLCNEIKAFLTS